MPSVTTVRFFPYEDIVYVEYSEKQEFKKIVLSPFPLKKKKCHVILRKFSNC